MFFATKDYKFYSQRCSHQGPLQRHYAGPFIEANDKFFVLNLNGLHDKVSVDRLKAAYGIKEPAPVYSNASELTKTVNLPDVSQRGFTRSGWDVRLPERYKDTNANAVAGGSSCGFQN